MSARVILCDCLGSQAADAGAIATTRASCSAVHTALCNAEADRLAAELAEAGEGVVVACGQEDARISEIAEEAGRPAPLCIDIRDRAGWSDEGRAAGRARRRRPPAAARDAGRRRRLRGAVPDPRPRARCARSSRRRRAWPTCSTVTVPPGRGS